LGQKAQWQRNSCNSLNVGVYLNKLKLLISQSGKATATAKAKKTQKKVENFLG